MAYHGISFGCNWGTVALQEKDKQEKDNPFEIVIFDSAPVNLPEFWVQYPTAHKVLNFMYLLKPKYEKYANFELAISHTKNCKEALFIYSDTDKFTPKEFGERFRKSSNAVNTDLKILSNIPHAMAIHELGDGYTNLCLGYLDNYFERSLARR